MRKVEKISFCSCDNLEIGQQYTYIVATVSLTGIIIKKEIESEDKFRYLLKLDEPISLSLS